MTAVIEDASCRICTKIDVDNMESLYESMLEEKTPAQIIEECFNIMVIPIWNKCVHETIINSIFKPILDKFEWWTTEQTMSEL